MPRGRVIAHAALGSNLPWSRVLGGKVFLPAKSGRSGAPPLTFDRTVAIRGIPHPRCDIHHLKVMASSL